MNRKDQKIKVLYCYDRNKRHMAVQQYKAVLQEIRLSCNDNEKLMLADLALQIKSAYNL
jgi:hypothetical protein